jgi:hypothetical protein
MNTRPHFIRIAAAVIATCGLSLLVAGVNAHGDNVQRGLANGLTQDGRSAPPAPEPVREARELEFGQSTGLDLVEMYQCTWGPTVDDISGWVGLWMLTVVVGGLPTAVVLYSGLHDPTRDR